MGFSLNDVMQQPKKKDKAVTAPKIHMIHYSKLHKSEDQFYSEDGIEELSEAIRIGKGIKQPLEVKRSKTRIGEYEIIAGHRRKLAAINLTEHGYEGYEFLPCIVSNDDDTINRINLILTNRTQRRKLSAYELMKEVQELSRLFRELEEESGEKVSARVLRKQIADALGVSETRVANMQNIERNLSKSGKEKMKTGQLNVSVANELAGLPENRQDALLLETKGDLSVKDVKREKENVSESDTKKKMKKTDKIVQCASDDEKDCRYCVDKECVRCGGFRAAPDNEAGKKNVSESDTNVFNHREEIIPGQVDIRDYKGIAQGELSRKEKVGVLKKAIEFHQEILNEMEGKIYKNTVEFQDMLSETKTKIEAYEFYMEFLQKEIQE